jgi:3-dehydroquinate synthase
LFLLADTNTKVNCVPLLPMLSGDAHIIVIPAGEQFKNLEQCQHVWEKLIEYGADRQSLLLNVGGGMVCDLGGFAAGCFQRGIRFAHIPTTVTAMADAAIGGKVGVDVGHLKNYLGLFNPAEWIWIEPLFLKTLPQKEVMSGVAEIIKHAIIGSPALWDILQHIDEIDQMPWKEVLTQSALAKMKVVEADPKEMGIRKILNFGHTVGHALESYFLKKNTPISHGQAVGLGMMAETRMAEEMGILSSDDADKIVVLIQRIMDFSDILIPPYDELITFMQRDKKAVRHELRFSLPDAIGSCRWDVEVKNPKNALDWLSEQAATSSLRYIKDTL